MHWNRSDEYDQKSYEEDKGWMMGLNGLCTPDNSFKWKDRQLTFEDDYDYAGIVDQRGKPAVKYINACVDPTVPFVTVGGSGTVVVYAVIVFDAPLRLLYPTPLCAYNWK